MRHKSYCNPDGIGIEVQEDKIIRIKFKTEEAYNDFVKQTGIIADFNETIEFKTKNSLSDFFG